MTATISLADGQYVLEIGDEQTILGGQGGLSPENIEEMLKLIYGKRSAQVVIRQQGGLSPENIKEMLDALYKVGKPPAEIIFTFKAR